MLSVNSMTLAQDNSPDKYIDFQKKIVFEEIDGIPDLPLSYYIDSDNNFIATNTKSNTVSIFDSNGKAISKFGRAGQGPGDFQYPMSSIRLKDNRLLVGEFGGKLTLFNEDGSSVIEIFQSKVLPLTQVIDLGNNKILLVGTKLNTDKSTSLLHIFDLSTKKIETSFLELPFSHQDYSQVLRMVAQLSVATVVNDEIIALVSPFTKLYSFSMNGVLKQTKDLEFPNFQKIEKSEASLNREELFEYSTTFSVSERMFSLKDGSFIVQYIRIKKIDQQNPNLRETEYNVALFNSNGDLIFDFMSPKELMAFDSVNSFVFFKGDENDVIGLEKAVFKQ